MRRISIIMIAAGLLAACGQGEKTDADANGNLSADEVEARMRTAAAEGSKMRPGQYDIKIDVLELSMPGMQGSMLDNAKAAMETTAQVCLTKEQVEKPDERFFSGGDQDCTYQRFDMSGGKIDLAMRCGVEGTTMNRVATGKVDANGYEMTMETSSPDARMPKSKVHMKATRTGDCAQ